MTRRRRRTEILRIVEERAVGTQAELVEALRERGLEVSQSSVSRDVRDLGLVKVPDAEGGYRYGAPDGAELRRPGRPPLHAVMEELVAGAAVGRAVVALRTPPGAADRVAIALDESGPDEVLATVAGDDTLFVLVRDEEDAEALRRRIESWTG